MSSAVTTATAAAASCRDSSVRDTEVISTFMSSSKLMCLRTSSESGDALFASAASGARAPHRSTQRTARCRGIASLSSVMFDPSQIEPTPNYLTCPRIRHWGFLAE